MFKNMTNSEIVRELAEKLEAISNHKDVVTVEEIEITIAHYMLDNQLRFIQLDKLLKHLIEWFNQMEEEMNLSNYDTYYVERANGRNEYWTYCNGRKVYVSQKLVEKSVKQGDKLVVVR